MKFMIKMKIILERDSYPSFSVTGIVLHKARQQWRTSGPSSVVFYGGKKENKSWARNYARKFVFAAPNLKTFFFPGFILLYASLNTSTLIADFKGGNHMICWQALYKKSNSSNHASRLKYHAIKHTLSIDLT